MTTPSKAKKIVINHLRALIRFHKKTYVFHCDWRDWQSAELVADEINSLKEALKLIKGIKTI